jgi:hypothetical protein
MRSSPRHPIHADPIFPPFARIELKRRVECLVSQRRNIRQSSGLLVTGEGLAPVGVGEARRMRQQMPNRDRPPGGAETGLSVRIKAFQNLP